MSIDHARFPDVDGCEVSTREHLYYIIFLMVSAWLWMLMTRAWIIQTFATRGLSKTNNYLTVYLPKPII